MYSIRIRSKFGITMKKYKKYKKVFLCLNKNNFLIYEFESVTMLKILPSFCGIHTIRLNLKQSAFQIYSIV